MFGERRRLSFSSLALMLVLHAADDDYDDVALAVVAAACVAGLTAWRGGDKNSWVRHLSRSEKKGMPHPAKKTLQTQCLSPQKKVLTEHNYRDFFLVFFNSCTFLYFEKSVECLS